MARVEHLGITPYNITPSDFMFTRKPSIGTPENGKQQHGEQQYNYGVVMTNFSHTDVMKYTHMEHNFAQMQDKPVHPLSARGPMEWYSFYGWVPENFFNRESYIAYQTWGMKYFMEDSCMLPTAADYDIHEKQVAKCMAKAELLAPHNRISKEQELLQKMFSELPENERNPQTKEDYNKEMEEVREKCKRMRAEREKRERQKYVDFVNRYEK